MAAHLVFVSFVIGIWEGEFDGKMHVFFSVSL